MAQQTRERKHKPARSTLSSKEKGGNNTKDTYKKDALSSQKSARYVLAVFSFLGICFGLYWKFYHGTINSIPTFARADQLYPQHKYTVNCSEDYREEQFEECKPKSCGRVVMDNLVTEEEALYLLGVAKKGLAFGGSNGGASILDLHSGALSMGEKFVDIYKILPEYETFTAEDFLTYRRVKNKIHNAIAEHFGIPLTSIYLTKPTFFSRMNTTKAKTVHDEYWHKHVDKTTYGSFHYTSLLYLTTYGSDFTGGRFIFVDDDRETAVEPRIGRVSFFTSGSENVHYVEKLESGVRYAITISFTCDPRMAISDPDVR